MALNIRKELDTPGAEYPLIQNEPHNNVLNETGIHFAQSDAEEDALVEATEPPLLDPADEAAQKAAAQQQAANRQPITLDR